LIKKKSCEEESFEIIYRFDYHTITPILFAFKSQGKEISDDLVELLNEIPQKNVIIEFQLFGIKSTNAFKVKHCCSKRVL
jgi:hypothetical protein